ncbi:MAG: YihY/virulence factor BrkB family protein [Caldisericia bacterium]|nr:YihY/virulence factor BrkB family protein [Caldisericia bacterium]
MHFYKDDCVMKAAGLSWALFLNMLPMLILTLSIASSLLPTGQSAVEFTRLFFRILDQFTPSQISNLQSIIDAAFQASLSSSVVAFFVMLWSLFIFYSWIKRTFDSIWKVRTSKRLFSGSKVRGMGVMILLMVLVVFTLIVYNILLFFIRFIDASTFVSFPQMTSTILLYFLNLTIAGFTFFAFFKWIPEKPVHTKAAFYAALVSLVLELVALFGFQLYLQYFSKTSIIYGSMFSIIVILIWMYYTMITLLFGCEFCKILHQSID